MNTDRKGLFNHSWYRFNHQKLSCNCLFLQQIHSEAIRKVLEDVEKKQTEMLTWPLTEAEDAGRESANSPACFTDSSSHIHFTSECLKCTQTE